MDWYPWNIRAWRADTAHLTTLEKGAYRELIDHYMDTRKPLLDDDRALARIAGLNDSEWEVISTRLRSFMVAINGRLHLKHCDEELARQDGRSTEKSQSAMRAAAHRWPGDSEQRGRELRSQRLAEARRKGTHTQAEWAAILAMANGHCMRCGNASNACVKDHITPIYQGGDDSAGNLQALCKKCSSSKGPENIDYRPRDWEQRLRDACKLPAECQRMPARGQDTTREDKEKRTPPNPLKGARRPKPNGLELADPRFDDFWETWPRNENKLGAKKSFAKALQKTTFATIMAAAQNHAADIRARQSRGDDFTGPHAATWLNQERWNDQPKTSAPAAKKPWAGL